MSSVLKATIENKTTSEVQESHSHSHKILYKQTKLSKNTDQIPMTVMTSLDTGRGCQVDPRRKQETPRELKYVVIDSNKQFLLPCERVL